MRLHRRSVFLQQNNAANKSDGSESVLKLCDKSVLRLLMPVQGIFLQAFPRDILHPYFIKGKYVYFARSKQHAALK